MTGSTVVAARWKVVGSDRGALADLRTWTQSIGTLEVLQGALAAVTDPTRPIEVRRVALSASAGFVSPRYTLVYTKSPAGEPEAHLASISHPRVNNLTQTERSVAGNLFVTAVKTVATQDQDPGFRAVALSVWQDMADALPAQAGIESTMIRVEALCDRHFRISNSSPLALSIGLAIDGVLKQTPRVQGQSKVDLLLAVNDSLTATFAGKRIGSATLNREKCK